ncbi:MAG: DinB family protein [Chloroflexi bacterium]|nr:DinB family protein [Chloroflexota bacterium]
MPDTGPYTMQRFAVHFAGRVMDELIASVADLSDEELHALPAGAPNTIGFIAWHVLRSADNVVLFAFARERTVWMRQGLHEAWGLPRIEQGTGMEQAAAAAVRFPGATALADYGRAVRDEILPRIEAMSDEYLVGVARVVPWGEVPRLEAIGQTIIVHGSQHLGEIAVVRRLLGRDAPSF